MIQIGLSYRIHHVKRIDHVEFLVVLKDPYGVEALQDTGSSNLESVAQRHIPRFDDLPTADDIRALESRLLGDRDAGYDQEELADEQRFFHFDIPG